MFKYSSSYLTCCLLFIANCSLLLTLSSCKKIYPTNQIPSYIKIDSIKFKPDFSIDRDSSYNITDAWVYVDDQPVGAYQLPAKFPVLYSGNHTVMVMAGIKINGISSTRGSYPFYTSYSTSVNLPEGNVIKLKPVVAYNFNYFNFVWKEDFENPNITLIKNAYAAIDTSISTIIKRVSNNKDSGYYYKNGGSAVGAVYLNQTRYYFESITDTFFVLPHGDVSSYLELDYKSNNSFTVGIMIITSGGIQTEEYLTIYPSNVWTKIYVYLTPEANVIPEATGYKIMFYHTLDPNVTKAAIYLDNIKLIRGS